MRLEGGAFPVQGKGCGDGRISWLSRLEAQIFASTASAGTLVAHEGGREGDNWLFTVAARQGLTQRTLLVLRPVSHFS